MEVIEYAWNAVSTVRSLTLFASDFVYSSCFIPYKPFFTIWTIFISVTGYTISLQSTPETNLPLLWFYFYIYTLTFIKISKVYKVPFVNNICRVITENKLQ